MKKVAVHFATGFEEIEALAVVDILRRADLIVYMVSVMGRRIVTGSHKIKVTTDKMFEEVDYDEIDMIVLPGGMPGATNLNAHEGLKQVVKKFNDDQKYISAICAAPLVLGNMGLLDGKDATCYPGFEKHLRGANIPPKALVEDGKIVTAKGPGLAIEFGLKLVEKLVNAKKAKEIKEAMIVS